MELGLSLEAAQAMTWGEFQIRLHGYIRREENELRKFRKVAYYAAIGSHLDVKKFPKKEVSFWPIGDEVAVIGATDEHKNKFLEAFKKYKEKKNGKNDTRG